MDKLIGLVAPHQCLVCGDEGALVCDWCKPDFASPVPSRCAVCLAATLDSRVCRRCRRNIRLQNIWVCTEYDDLPKALIHGLKFERKLQAAQTIAELMVGSLPFLPPSTVVCHVPTTTNHVRQRGYDHAKLIAKNLARGAGLTHATLLSRTDQLRQVGSKREKRLRQLENSFLVCDEAVVKGAHILLVDDVMTTGGTLGAASRMLYSKGAKSVSAVVFAQKK